MQRAIITTLFRIMDMSELFTRSSFYSMSPFPKTCSFVSKNGNGRSMRLLFLAVVPFRFLLSIVPFRFVPFYPVPLATTLEVEWCAVSVLSSRWALTFARGTRYRSAARYLLVQPSPRSSQLRQTRSPWMQLR